MSNKIRNILFFNYLTIIKTIELISNIQTIWSWNIFSVFVILGIFNLELFKNHLLQHVVEKRDSKGDLMFPRIRHQLVSSWGNYAWNAHMTFRIENHIIVTNAVHRGRSVGENNIQVRILFLNLVDKVQCLW